MADPQTRDEVDLPAGNPAEEEGYYLASQWRLVWRRFKKHRLALISAGVIALMYLIVLFPEFFAPQDPAERFADFPYAPPQRIRIVDEKGKFHIRPFVYGIEQELDLKTFKRTYHAVEDKKYPLKLFAHGSEYKLWNLFHTDIHLIGADEEAPLFIFGTDIQGRDVLSRIILGSRISLSIGFVGVVMSFILGIIMGGISGFFGGMVDTIIQRFIEILRSFPTLPLWMALAAALPAHWSILRIYFFITIILSILGWTRLARVVRGKFLALREEDFVIAAKTAGASNTWIIRRHLVPSFMSHIIAAATLSIPAMIIGETALSFLGVGLRPPAVSWGVLLQSAQNVKAVISAPWLLIPALFVIVTVLAFNFVGDGLRDAADPYAT